VNEKITVLVADDNSDFTMTLSNYLEKEEQIQIVGIARDGNEAYDMAVNLKPDILLLDIIMPHLDGLGVLEKLGETGLITIAELARRLNFAADETALAAGWLARENKIYIERRNGLLYIRKE
jgi:chemotaxis response regulator CheB